ncbi:secreted RxLR effector protein 161-like [Miscanthus floridulus]|uniref:secreted RxLR effector protein 161-like n=1 Tax=Miscanthus floridulus TaxID=154761 RepID=UPI0034596BF7
MEPRLKLSKASTTPIVDAIAYRSIVGSLRYLVNTRPDLAFSVGYVSRFMEKPTTEHLVAVKRVLRYIFGTLDYDCYYTRKEKDTHLVGFSDSDHAGDIDTRRSTSGVLYFLGNNVITWQSQKSKVVALYSCKAEYIAGTTAACQGVWLTRLLSELKGKREGAVKIYIDSEFAIQLSKNPIFHDRSKHIDTRYHYIRECIEEGRVYLASIGTTEQLADILTKALAREHLCELCAKLGLVKLKQKHMA